MGNRNLSTARNSKSLKESRKDRLKSATDASCFTCKGQIPDAVHARRIDGDETKKPCAVIATFLSGHSYDCLFQNVLQCSPDPERTVPVFMFDYIHIQPILARLRKQTLKFERETARIIDDFAQCIADVENDCVLFNFECCSSCSEQGFGQMEHKADIMELLRWIISNRHNAMFGDFSLKSLITEWESAILGPNPFINLGECSTSISLRFDCEVLQACPNAQLQNVGRMCHEGHAVLTAMPSTIVYSVLPGNPQTDVYSLHILTIAERSGGFTRRGSTPLLQIGNRKGTAGHIMLRYTTGACIFTSAGHWIELAHLDVSEEGVIKTSELHFGSDYAKQIKAEVEMISSEEQRRQFIQEQARQIVQSSAPCCYSKHTNNTRSVHY